jgi:hypothetical protein
MCGVWLVPDLALALVIWCHPFPSRVSSDLVTSEHGNGQISISDLEFLAGIIAYKDIATQCINVC